MTTKSDMRKALLNNGIRTRGMDDAAIAAAYAALDSKESPKVKLAPVPPPKPKPIKAKTKAKSNGNGKAKPAKPQQPHVNADKLNQLGELIGSLVDAPQAELDESKVIDLIKQHSQAPQRIEYEINVTRPDSETKKISGAHKMLADVLDVAAIGENVFLAGPAACGKTTLAAQAAEALGYDFQFTGSVSDEFRLSGFIDANGTYHETSFYHALTFAERGFDGCVFLLDEADASLPAALLAANSAFENGYFQFPTGRVEFDKSKVFFICAANTMGKGANRQYTGRYPLDDAFLNRFERLDMDYDTGVEMAMAENAWLSAGGDKDSVGIALDFAHEVIALRRKLAEKNILALISPRHTRRGAALLARGWALDKVRQGLYTDLNADQKRTLGL